jgi:hypothetical protein
LSEGKNRFRVRNGETEIEYEGPLKEVNARYEKALEWIASRQHIGTTTTTKKEESGDQEKDKRGGVRKAIYPPLIEKMKKENFFKPKKSLDEVIKKLEDWGAPTRGKRTTIRNALIYDTHKEGSKLKSTKEEKTWFFWED